MDQHNASRRGSSYATAGFVALPTTLIAAALSAVVVGAVIAGGGVYTWQRAVQRTHEQEIQKLQHEVEQLQVLVEAELPEMAAEASPTPLPTSPAPLSQPSPTSTPAPSGSPASSAVLSVSKFIANRTSYVGKRVTIRGKVWAEVARSEEPCPNTDPCSPFYAVTLNLIDVDLGTSSATLPLYRTAAGDAYELLSCKILLDGPYDCGRYVDGTVMNLTGDVVKYQEPSQWVSRGGSPPRVTGYREVIIFAVE